MDLQEVVAASREIDGQLLLRAKRLAGMLHKVTAAPVAEGTQAARATCLTISGYQNTLSTQCTTARVQVVPASDSSRARHQPTTCCLNSWTPAAALS